MSIETVKEAINVEIARLNAALQLLNGEEPAKRKTGPGTRHKLSQAARNKISLAQIARWAKTKKAEKVAGLKKLNRKTAKKAPKPTTPAAATV